MAIIELNTANLRQSGVKFSAEFARRQHHIRFGSEQLLIVCPW